MRLIFCFMFLIFNMCGRLALAQEEVFEGDSSEIESLDKIDYFGTTKEALPTGLPIMRPNVVVWQLGCVGVWWQNRDTPKATAAACTSVMKDINAFYTRNSRNKFSFVIKVADEMKVPYDCDRKNQSLMATNIKAQIKVKYPAVSLNALVLPQECTGAHAGGGIAHVISTQMMTATHEVGHLVHLQHTGVYRKNADGTFYNEAYADKNSIMGRVISKYITAPQYYFQGWLNADEYVLYNPATVEYLIKDIVNMTDKGGLVTVIVPPQYANGKYVFVSMMRGEIKMHHPIYGGNWGGSIKIAEFADEYTDNNFSGLTVKRLRNVGDKAYISITSGIINEPTPTTVPTIAPTKSPSPIPTKVPTIKPTVAPTKSPSPMPTKTANPTPKPTLSPTPAPVKIIVDCIPEVVTNGAWAAFGPAMKQYRTYHKPSNAEYAVGTLLIDLMTKSHNEGITVANDLAMLATADKMGATMCRVTLPGDSYVLLYAKKGNSGYIGPNMVFREVTSSKIIVIGPHDDSDYTHTVTKLATQRTNALATISNGQNRHVNSDSDFMHHSNNLGAHMVWRLDANFPKTVFLHTHGMANPGTVLYRSRSKVLGDAYEKAVTNCTDGFKYFTPHFNAYYQTETGIKSGMYLKVEMPVKFYHNRPEVLACIVKYLEGNYAWAYDEVVQDSSDKQPDSTQADDTPEDNINEVPE